MFRFKGIADKEEKTWGVLLRLFGIDISLLLLGAWREWKLLDLRIPCNCGVYCQIGFVLLSLGRLPDATVYGEV